METSQRLKKPLAQDDPNYRQGWPCVTCDFCQGSTPKKRSNYLKVQHKIQQHHFWGDPEDINIIKWKCLACLQKEYPNNTEAEVRAIIAEATSDSAWNKERSEIYRLELAKHKDTEAWVGYSARAIHQRTARGRLQTADAPHRS